MSQTESKQSQVELERPKPGRSIVGSRYEPTHPIPMALQQAQAERLPFHISLQRRLIQDMQRDAMREALKKAAVTDSNQAS